VFLNLSGNALLVEFVLLNAASVGQPRRVEDPNLGKRLRISTTFKNSGAYYYVVVALKFVKARLVSPRLGFCTIFLVGVVEDIEVVVINIIADKDIGDEFQDRRLANAGLPNKKDGVDIVLRCLNNTLLERLHVARNTIRASIKYVVVTYLRVRVLYLSSSSDRTSSGSAEV
jgi:hypothetical protein